MKRSLLLFSLLFLFQKQGLMAVNFSSKEKAVIYTEASKVLRNYQSILNSIGESAVTDVEKAKSSSESFLELFVNRQVLLFNDLDPTHRLSEFYEAETYASNIILWYPDGIVINMDVENARVGEIMTHEENVFSIDMMVTKSINGNYLNETLNKNKEELTFRIAFGLENKDFTNFRIVGIRNASSNVVVDYSQALKEVNSEELSTEELEKIYTEIKIILQDYTNFLSLLGDPQEAAEDKEYYKTSFEKLFDNLDTRTMVYNDIMPDPATKLISVQEYLKNYVADFPNGIKNIKINVDSAKFGSVMKDNDDSYYTFVEANKFFSGSYKGKEAYREMFPLIFKLSFNVSGKTYINFKINSVDISSVNFYSDTPEGTLERKPSIVISPVTRKGLVLSLIGSVGQTRIISENIESLTLASNDHQWDVSTEFGFTGGIGINYYFNDNLSLRSGLEIDKNSALFSLNDTFTDSTNFISDINAFAYNKTVAAELFDSLVTMNYVSIPIVFSYVSGKPGKYGFYAEAGSKVSVSVRTSYMKNGKYEYKLYYDDISQTGYSTSDQFGAYKKEYINDKDKIKTTLFGFSFYASAGINIPLGYYSSLMLGPEINLGLTDVMSNFKTYSDIFDNLYDHLPTKINYFGLRLSLAYKL